MGCPCELRFHADTKQAVSRAVEQCLREIRRFENKYSRYQSDSVTSSINQSAGRAPVPIDPETAALLEYAAVCYEQSEGLFDITSGVFRQVWYRQRTTLPQQSELDACLEKAGWDKVQYSGTQVYLPLAGMELDFGGVVKEYAADAAATIAGNAGIRHGLVNLGGDIRHRRAATGWAALDGRHRSSAQDRFSHSYCSADRRRVDDVGRVRAVRGNRRQALQPPDRSHERAGR